MGPPPPPHPALPSRINIQPVHGEAVGDVAAPHGPNPAAGSDRADERSVGSGSGRQKGAGPGGTLESPMEPNGALWDGGALWSPMEPHDGALTVSTSSCLSRTPVSTSSSSRKFPEKTG